MTTICDYPSCNTFIFTTKENRRMGLHFCKDHLKQHDLFIEDLT